MGKYNGKIKQPLLSNWFVKEKSGKLQNFDAGWLG